MIDTFLSSFRPYNNLKLNLFPLYTSLIYYREIWGGDIHVYKREKNNFGKYKQHTSISILIDTPIKSVLNVNVFSVK